MKCCITFHCDILFFWGPLFLLSRYLLALSCFPNNALFFCLIKEVSHVDIVLNNTDVPNMPRRTLDEKLKEMKDQVIRAKAYINFSPANSSSHFVKELKLRIKDVQRAMSQCTKDHRVSRRCSIFLSLCISSIPKELFIVG